MRRPFFRPPSEVASLGLLQLRLTLAVYLIGTGLTVARHMTADSPEWRWWALALPSLVAAVLTLLGALTRIVPVIVVITQLEQLMFDHLPTSLYWAGLTLSAWPPMLAMSIGMCLSLLGPGRYSMDSYLFGAHEIHIPRLPSRPAE